MKKNQEDEKLKKRKTYGLRLTKFELLHLRDLFSVLLSPEAKKTVSQALAESENRPVIESLLWKKVSDLVEEAEIPFGDDAPDFLIASTSTPTLGVFQLATDPTPQQDSEDNPLEE